MLTHHATAYALVSSFGLYPIQVGVVGALSAFYRDAADVNDPQQRDMAALRIIAKMPTLAAIAYKTAVGALPHTCRACMSEMPTMTA